jgi:DNA-binding NarL/FixJ family response regulator
VTDPVSVFLCEDSAQLRRALRLWLERDERIEVVGEAGDGDETLRGIAEHRPDVAVLDLSMPRSRGADTIPEIRAASPATRVLVLTGTPLEWAQPVLSGADAFLLKPAALPDVADRVVELGAGRA